MWMMKCSGVLMAHLFLLSIGHIPNATMAWL